MKILYLLRSWNHRSSSSLLGSWPPSSSCGVSASEPSMSMASVESSAFTARMSPSYSVYAVRALRSAAADMACLVPGHLQRRYGHSYILPSSAFATKLRALTAVQDDQDTFLEDQCFDQPFARCVCCESALLFCHKHGLPNSCASANKSLGLRNTTVFYTLLLSPPGKRCTLCLTSEVHS